MPATTNIASWTLTNLGPVTTTFTPAPSCSRAAYNRAVFGRWELYLDSTDDDVFNDTSSILFMGTHCSATASPSARAGCIPFGSEIDSQFDAFTSTWSSLPSREYRIDYYSPGLICPSGYSTAGTATKSAGGAVSSSGPAFVPSNSTKGEWDLGNLQELVPNVLLENLFEGESAVLCCPSNYTAVFDGKCTSIIEDYPIPSEICLSTFDFHDFDDDITSTETIFGATYTGVADVVTGTIPGAVTTVTLTTTTTSAGDDYFAYAPSWVAGDVVEVLYLVHAASDTAVPSDNATASSNSTGDTSVAATAKTGLSMVMMIVTVGVAFTSGFMMLVL